ncbi:transporter substrate-binding domain-containing protein [Subtercola endophyticus]|uniref:transporter substrate-binding domain-containing protein n=1 Tax=Subtercola endophyticus TaxID=2895559 RepID=UPI001E5B7756|nr:transporter substrate-binding domain-containing protein [Subtercola endophyticus]UFS57624.1 transporter substrate-binding domain-containing protein [Subtercola endophyticus]
MKSAPLHRIVLVASLGLAATLAISGCSSSTGTAATSSSTAAAAAATVQLPSSFAGSTLVAPAVTGYPPYAFLQDGKVVGISADLATALSGPFGSTVSLKQDSFENALLGTNSGTYIGTFGADVTADREAAYDQVSFLNDHYEFMSLKGKTIGSDMMSLCGLTISVVAADSAIPVLQTQSTACTTAGKGAITVSTFADQGAATLAVSSKQVDATTATLSNLGYISNQASGQFELGGPKYQYVLIGIATKKGNGMAQAMADGINELIANGEYEKILEAYGVQGDAVDKAEVNPNPVVGG